MTTRPPSDADKVPPSDVGRVPRSGPGKSILSPPHLATLHAFALSNVLLALDYDGTLAPIAETPRSARMRPGTRRLLAQVTERYPCVVISGRALVDLAKRLHGIPLRYIFGNHGLESSADATDANQTHEWVDRLRQRLPNTPGLIFEDKGQSVTIHYRQVRDKRGARAAIHEALTGLKDVRALGGIEAISILPRGGRDKGGALQEARRQFACDTAIFVGDDETDEDAFASAGPDQLLSIRVGPAADSKARYFLECQDDIDAFLETLLSAREKDSQLSNLGVGEPRRA